MSKALVAILAAICVQQTLCFAPSAAPLSLRSSRSAVTTMTMAEDKQSLPRRAVMFGLVGGAMSSLLGISKANAEEKQLSPEELDEYKKLLKQAFKIQGIIDANVEATKESLGGESGVQEYLKAKKEGKLPVRNDEDDLPATLPTSK